jgi:hypothetical protein
VLDDTDLPDIETEDEIQVIAPGVAGPPRRERARPAEPTRPDPEERIRRWVRPAGITAGVALFVALIAVARNDQNQRMARTGIPPMLVPVRAPAGTDGGEFLRRSENGTVAVPFMRAGTALTMDSTVFDSAAGFIGPAFVPPTRPTPRRASAPARAVDTSLVFDTLGGRGLALPPDSVGRFVVPPIRDTVLPVRDTMIRPDSMVRPDTTRPRPLPDTTGRPPVRPDTTGRPPVRPDTTGRPPIPPDTTRGS